MAAEYKKIAETDCGLQLPVIPVPDSKAALMI
jgi:hypothetical protein